MRHAQQAVIMAIVSMGIAGAQQTPARNVKTMALDPKTQRVHLPAAETDVIPEASAAESPRHKIRQGSFEVLVLRPTQDPATKP